MRIANRNGGESQVRTTRASTEVQLGLEHTQRTAADA